MNAAQRDGAQWGLVGGEGICWLARVQASPRGRGLSGLPADAVSQWGKRAGTREHQSGPPAWALDDHGVGGEWAALAAGQRPACVVSRALRERGPALATAGDGGRGAPVTHGALALPRDRGDTRRGGAQRGVSTGGMRCHAAVGVLVEAARCITGPAQHAVG